MKYKRYIKGYAYRVFYKKRVFTAIYKYRWFNKEIKKWIYQMESLDRLSHYSLDADKTDLVYSWSDNYDILKAAYRQYEKGFKK